jgi:hypothetical protein
MSSIRNKEHSQIVIVLVCNIPTETFDICYVSGVLATFQLVVISFSNKGRFFLEGLPLLHFCNKYDICNGN